MEMNQSFWNYVNTRYVHIELSNSCNAACPLCPRYVNRSLMVNPELELGSISLQKFKEWFPLDFVQRSAEWIFCGTNGDPMMAKDAYEIIEYVATNSSAKIQINTNGSMRSPDFWKKLGNLFSKNSSQKSFSGEEDPDWKHHQKNSLYGKNIDQRRYVIFSIDGLEDTNHIYRRNVNWKKLISNVKAYTSTGAESVWDFLIFKHNEHQIEDAKKFANEIGISTFIPKRPFGFDTGNPDQYMDMNVYDVEGRYLYKIEPATNLEWRLNKSTNKLKTGTDQISLPPKKTTKEEARKKWESKVEIESKRNRFPNRFKTSSVHCKSCHPYGKEIYVDCNGNVFPCCFVGTMFNGDFNYWDPIQLRKRLYEYGTENISLKNDSLQNILNGGYLDQVFANRWENADEEERTTYCFSTCSVNHIKDLFVN